MSEQYEGGQLHPIHAWIARIGVLAIAVLAFMFVYDAGRTFAEAVGYRVALGKLWPWLIEGFLALVVYTGSIIRRQGGSVAYPAVLFSTLLAVSGYMNVRVHTHHGPGVLALKPVESGSASALPVLILAASVHLLIRTFEGAPRSAGATPDTVMPDALTVGKIQETWAAGTEPAPVDVVAQVEPETVPEPKTFSHAELERLPAPAPQLKGQSNFLRQAEAAPTPKARDFWLNLAQVPGTPSTLF